MPVTRTQEEIRQVVNPQVQHVVGTDDVENHIIQEKINQMTKHAPRVQVVEKTVEEHFATLAHLASRIPTIMKFGDETGEDPFAKVEEFDHGVDQQIAGHFRTAEQESIGRER